MKVTKKKKNQWKQWLIIAFFAAIGGVCGLLLPNLTAQLLDAGTPVWLEMLVLCGSLLLLYVAMFLQLVIHEAGHLVFGQLSGYRFSSFRIGSFMLLSQNGKFTVKRLSLAGTAGQCLMSPPEMSNGTFPVVLYNLGGCIMNLAASAVLFLLYLLFPQAEGLRIFLLMGALIGVAIALMNGIPLRLGAVDNDGYNALSLRKDPHAMRAFWLQLKVSQQTTLGIRLKDMPEEWFALPEDEAMQNSMVAGIGVFACNRLMDQHKFPEAGQLMAHLLCIDSGMVGLHRNLLVCDRIYCELIHENRPAVLSSLYTAEQQKFMQAMKNFPTVIRTEYAYALLADRDEAKANTYLKRMTKIAKTYPYPSDICSEQELVEHARLCAAAASNL